MAAAAIMLPPHPNQNPNLKADEVQVGEKILKRIELSKMSLKLQETLALASYKSKHGLIDLPFNNLVSAHEEASKRRRLNTNNSQGSISSSSFSSVDTYLESSPIQPIFSDDVFPPPSTSKKRQRSRDRNTFSSSFGRGRRLATNTATQLHSEPYYGTDNVHPSWRSHRQPDLAASSPIRRNLHPDFRTAHGPDLSFVSTVHGPIPSSPLLPSSPPALGASFVEKSSQSNTYGSPRTPPPTRSRKLGKDMLEKGNAEVEGADLLLFLATSPSPAVHNGQRNPYRAQNTNSNSFLATPTVPSRRIFSPNPTTPDMSKHAFPSFAPSGADDLPPSHLLKTPDAGMFNTIFSTPRTGTNFFGEFCSPSPAHPSWSMNLGMSGGGMGFPRTPARVKTPLAAREARRKLSYDLDGGEAGKRVGLGL